MSTIYVTRTRLTSRPTPFSAALLTVGFSAIAYGTVIYLSGLPWKTGISWSQAGRVGQPTAWLFSVTTLLFGAAVFATGRLMVRAGRERGDLEPGAYAVASALPAVSLAGFVIVALCPVGGAPVLAFAHNVASWAALGAFWLGMLLTPWLCRLPRVLRYFSAGAAVVVFGMWLPNGLRFMRLITARPISMLAMEVVVFPLCLGWFAWLAWEWSKQR